MPKGTSARRRQPRGLGVPLKLELGLMQGMMSRLGLEMVFKLGLLLMLALGFELGERDNVTFWGDRNQGGYRHKGEKEDGCGRWFEEQGWDGERSGVGTSVELELGSGFGVGGLGLLELGQR